MRTLQRIQIAVNGICRDVVMPYLANFSNKIHSITSNSLPIWMKTIYNYYLKRLLHLDLVCVCLTSILNSVCFRLTIFTFQ